MFDYFFVIKQQNCSKNHSCSSAFAHLLSQLTAPPGDHNIDLFQVISVIFAHKNDLQKMTLKLYSSGTFLHYFHVVRFSSITLQSPRKGWNIFFFLQLPWHKHIFFQHFPALCDPDLLLCLYFWQKTPTSVELIHQTSFFFFLCLNVFQNYLIFTCSFIEFERLKLVVFGEFFLVIRPSSYTVFYHRPRHASTRSSRLTKRLQGYYATLLWDQMIIPHGWVWIIICRFNH